MKKISKEEFNRKKSSYSTVILCATDYEEKIIIDSMKKNCATKKNECFIYEVEGYFFHLGFLGDEKVILTKQLTMGNINLGSSVHTIHAIYNNLGSINVKSIVMIGCCAGLKDDLPMGSVIISKEVVAYTVVKATKGFLNKPKLIERGFKYHSQPIFNCFATAINQQEFEFTIKTGQVLSGDILMNNRRIKKELINKYPDAIALEMEGAGVSAAASGHKIQWILVKGISDSAVNKKGSENQERATRNAIEVCEKVFSSDYFQAYNNSQKIARKKVLISGSYLFEQDDADKVENFSYELSKKLVENGYKVITGYGLCIGPAVVAGAYGVAKTKKIRNLSEVLDAFPFPREFKTSIFSIEAIKRENREAMVADCDYAVFIYGLKSNSESATGMIEEFDMAHKNGAICIPIGKTKYTAETIWKEINKNIYDYYPNASGETIDLYNKLNCSDLNDENICETILNFIESMNYEEE